MTRDHSVKNNPSMAGNSSSHSMAGNSSSHSMAESSNARKSLNTDVSSHAKSSHNTAASSSARVSPSMDVNSSSLSMAAHRSNLRSLSFQSRKEPCRRGKELRNSSTSQTQLTLQVDTHTLRSKSNSSPVNPRARSLKDSRAQVKKTLV